MGRLPFWRAAIAAAAFGLAPQAALAAPTPVFEASATTVRPEQAAFLYRTLLGAGWQGLEPADYVSPQLDDQLASPDPQTRRQAEAQLVEAVVRYANHVRRGRTP